jgi:hypothetical protein
MVVSDAAVGQVGWALLQLSSSTKHRYFPLSVQRLKAQTGNRTVTVTSTLVGSAKGPKLTGTVL